MLAVREGEKGGDHTKDDDDCKVGDENYQCSKNLQVVTKKVVVIKEEGFKFDRYCQQLLLPLTILHTAHR